MTIFNQRSNNMVRSFGEMPFQNTRRWQLGHLLGTNTVWCAATSPSLGPHQPTSPALFNDSAFPRFPHPSHPSPPNSSHDSTVHFLLPMAASSYYYCSYSEGMQSRRLSSNESGLRRRCLMMVKQQRTRFYILRRCVSLLLCWHDWSQVHRCSFLFHDAAPRGRSSTARAREAA